MTGVQTCALPISDKFVGGVVIKVRRVDGDVSAFQSHFPITRRPTILLDKGKENTVSKCFAVVRSLQNIAAILVGNDVFVVSRQKDKSFFLFDVD